MQNVCGTALADQGPDPVIVAAGDIAGSWSGDESTAAVIDTIKPAAVLTLGDNVYDTGAASEFNNYWGAKTAANKSWGHLLDVVKPAPGNHDHATANLTGYCGYFGASAHCAGGDSGAAYYSFDVGKWHIISLDSGCSSPSSCADTMATGSTMRTWLTNDLKAHNNACMIAYWHHPRFSSGAHGNDTRSQSVWAELQAAGVDLILNGHDHNYERFAAQNSAGASDPNGIVEFVVGTGGTSLRAMGATKANSAKINNTSLGVLKLTLHDTSYDFEFVKANGTFTDKGVGIACH